MTITFSSCNIYNISNQRIVEDIHFNIENLTIRRTHIEIIVIRLIQSQLRMSIAKMKKTKLDRINY